MTTQADPNSTGSVQYNNRWNEENINMNVEASQTTMMRLYNTACIGRTGMIVKAAVAVGALAFIFIIGYTTGYYVHRCP